LNHNLKYRFVKYFDAPPETVWQAWTEPDWISRWFGSDPNGKVLMAELDVRPGGRFEVTFCNADETRHTCSGIYTDVQPYSKLTFSWGWRSEPNVESFVTLLLMPVDKSTRMDFEHSKLGSESLHDYENGWQRAFAKLECILDGETN
jgi:uncharacterized protein YndB with AHSA1/START domain